MNRFLYAEANPWTLVDPSGHAAGCGPDGIYCSTSTSAALQCGQGSTCAAKPTHPAEHWSPSGGGGGGGGGAPEATPETAFADQDTWGEDRAIAYASAAGTSAQAAAVHCTTINRSGPFCQTAQQQADGAATTAGIGDALGRVVGGFGDMATCLSMVGVNCSPAMVIGLGQLTANPSAAMTSIAFDRLAAISSGDKREGADAITSTLIDLFGLALLPIGGGAADAGRAATLGAKVASPSELVDLANLRPNLSVTFAEGDMLNAFRNSGIDGMTGPGAKPGTWDMYLNPDPASFTRDTVIHEYMHYVMQKRNWAIGYDSNASHAYIYDFLARLRNTLKLDGN